MDMGDGNGHEAIERTPPQSVGVSININAQGGLTVTFPTDANGQMNEVMTLYILERGRMAIEDHIRAVNAPKVMQGNGISLDALKKFLPRNLG